MKTIIFFMTAFLVLSASQGWAVDENDGASVSGPGPSKKPWLLSKGAAARESKRFSLQSWLENKDRRALMDMWLTINTPSPYEFIVGGAMQSYTLNSTSTPNPNAPNYKNYVGEVSAYAKFIGVTGEYANNLEEHYNDVTGQFNLRVFGHAVQSSHLTFHYGLRTRTAEGKSYRLNQRYPAVTLQIYLMKYFGIQGNYRMYSPITESFYGDTQGDELNAGIFIDFGSFRIYGDYFQERQNSKMNGVENNFNRTGTKSGLKIFF